MDSLFCEKCESKMQNVGYIIENNPTSSDNRDEIRTDVFWCHICKEFKNVETKKLSR